MKIIFELELEEKISNIGIAKALTEVPGLTDGDLCEIGSYLAVYSTARSSESLAGFQCEMEKGGVVSV